MTQELAPTRIVDNLNLNSEIPMHYPKHIQKDGYMFNFMEPYFPIFEQQDKPINFHEPVTSDSRYIEQTAERLEIARQMGIKEAQESAGNAVIVQGQKKKVSVAGVSIGNVSNLTKVQQSMIEELNKRVQELKNNDVSEEVIKKFYTDEYLKIINSVDTVPIDEEGKPIYGTDASVLLAENWKESKIDLPDEEKRKYITDNYTQIQIDEILNKLLRERKINKGVNPFNILYDYLLNNAIIGLKGKTIAEKQASQNEINEAKYILLKEGKKRPSQDEIKSYIESARGLKASLEYYLTKDNKYITSEQATRIMERNKKKIEQSIAEQGKVKLEEKKQTEREIMEEEAKSRDPRRVQEITNAGEQLAIQINSIDLIEFEDAEEKKIKSNNIIINNNDQYINKIVTNINKKITTKKEGDIEIEEYKKINANLTKSNSKAELILNLLKPINKQGFQTYYKKHEIELCSAIIGGLLTVGKRKKISFDDIENIYNNVVRMMEYTGERPTTLNTTYKSSIISLIMFCIRFTDALSFITYISGQK
jgi:hypothetical protein